MKKATGLIDAETLDSIDPVIHAPARLAIMALLRVVKKADFTFLYTQTGLTRGNLSSHLTKLEKSDFVEIEKLFEGKQPKTYVSLTKTGKKALDDYWKHMQPLLKLIGEN